MVTARARRRLVQLLVTAVAALALVVLAPAAVPRADAALCSGYNSYKGYTYCPASIEGVQATQYGTGKRVYLDNAVVSAVATRSVTIKQQRMRNPCTYSSSWGCGQTMEVYWVSLTVPWTLTSKPAVGAAIKLYGTTTTGNLNATGYVATTPPCGDYC